MQESGTIATFGSTYTVLTVHVITKHHYIKVHVHTFYSFKYVLQVYEQRMGVVSHYTLRYWKSKPVCSLITGQKRVFRSFISLCCTVSHSSIATPVLNTAYRSVLHI